MSSKPCNDCGATFDDEKENCNERFNQLLALDHSRREPWGSRHGQAFAAFAIQHPSQYSQSMAAAWFALYSIYVLGEQPENVFDAMLNSGATLAGCDVPERPSSPMALPRITIKDLGDFDSHTYTEDLDNWCRSGLEMWGVEFDVESL